MSTHQNTQSIRRSHTSATQIRSTLTNGIGLIRGALGATLLLIKSI